MAYNLRQKVHKDYLKMNSGVEDHDSDIKDEQSGPSSASGSEVCEQEWRELMASLEEETQRKKDQKAKKKLQLKELEEKVKQLKEENDSREGELKNVSSQRINKKTKSPHRVNAKEMRALENLSLDVEKHLAKMGISNHQESSDDTTETSSDSENGEIKDKRVHQRRGKLKSGKSASVVVSSKPSDLATIRTGI